MSAEVTMEPPAMYEKDFGQKKSRKLERRGTIGPGILSDGAESREEKKARKRQRQEKRERKQKKRLLLTGSAMVE